MPKDVNSRVPAIIGSRVERNAEGEITALILPFPKLVPKNDLDARYEAVGEILETLNKIWED